MSMISSVFNSIHKLIRWSLIAGRIPGRTDNEIKNYWNTHLSRRSSSDQELLEHYKPSINPKNQHNEKKGLIPSDQSHKAKAIRPKHFKCTKVDVGIPSHLQDDKDHQIMVDTTNNINAFSSSSVPAGSSSNDLFILDLLNSTEIQQAHQMKEWQVAMVENSWRGSPIIAAVDPFEPNIDGEVAFNALSYFMNIEDYQYWIN
ncbi:unnamed protein product [Prunus brigantina]